MDINWHAAPPRCRGQNADFGLVGDQIAHGDEVVSRNEVTHVCLCHLNNVIDSSGIARVPVGGVEGL